VFVVRSSLFVADGGCDWTAGIPACMSAKHEKAPRQSRAEKFDAAEATALQARMPAVQSVDLASELRNLVARDMGKPLAPSKIHFVSALPKTRNAKVMRRVLRSSYLGEDPGDLSALENPQSVEEIGTISKS